MLFRSVSQSRYYEVLFNYKFYGRKEIDIYIPSIKLGIEFDGLFWHSTAKRADKFNLRDKFNLAKAVGIRTVHIFEDEWANNKEAVITLLRGMTGKVEKIHGRKCLYRKVSDTDAGAFYKKYHIQGAPRTGEHFGLHHEEKLVMCMTMTQSTSIRGEQNGTWELVRMASLARVAGGASKLFKSALMELNPDHVISYSDNRLFDGGVYPIMGFKKKWDIPPDYYYVKPSKTERFRKSNFTRSKLANNPDFDPALTEEQNMDKMGWHRIYDCGKVRWDWHRQSTV